MVEIGGENGIVEDKCILFPEDGGIQVFCLEPKSVSMKGGISNDPENNEYTHQRALYYDVCNDRMDPIDTGS